MAAGITYLFRMGRHFAPWESVMKKTTLALALLLGGFAAMSGTASAAPIAPAGLQAETGVTPVRMTARERMMMRRHMMRKRMMNRHHHRAMRHRMMHRM